MRNLWRDVRDDTYGVTALEYALIAALVAVVIIGGVSLLGTSVSKVFSTVANTI
jgi:pilus assembly protein Flp/PilA